MSLTAVRVLRIRVTHTKMIWMPGKTELYILVDTAVIMRILFRFVFSREKKMGKYNPIKKKISTAIYELHCFGSLHKLLKRVLQ